MKNSIVFSFMLLLALGMHAQEEIEKALFELPDIIFQQIETKADYEACYELRIKQPIDHNDPSKGHFYQRAYLSHMGFDAPSVIVTNGYGRPSNNITELASLLGANQINVEHRYFLESVPEEMDYDYLNFVQVTADLHKINTIFRSIYDGPWVASGISKGGTTTIFYRYFYPDDVDVSVPYVAPVNLSDEDPRIYSFLDTIGSDQCRADIYAYQRDLLTNADEYKSLLKWFAKGKGLEFNYLSFDEAFEYAVLEYPFSFWQYGRDCSKIPSPDTDTETKLNYFLDIVGLQFFSDSDMKAYASHYYQSGTEMGYYGYETEDFEGLLKYLPMDPHPSAVFMPDKMVKPFDASLTTQVFEWTKEADNMIYINGALDTWSATAAPPSDQNNSLYYFLEGKHHATARIASMNSQEKYLLIGKLEEWLGIEIK
ncbi:MAG: S28 family serine protease [Saprospiraceae bacterium]